MLSIISYNVWFDKRQIGPRLEAILAILTNMRPDIICLQEVTALSYSVFVDNLAKVGYTSCYKSLDHFKKVTESVGYGVLTLSRRPILSVNIVPFMKTKMGRYYTIVKLDCGYVLNTHLESLGVNRDVRSQQIGQILEFFSMVPTAILTMDSNLTDDGADTFPIIDWITDAFIADGSDESKKYTYDCMTNDNVLNKFRTRLDRIYYKGNIRQHEFNLFGETPIAETRAPPSDHFGVRMVFSTDA